MRMRGVEITFYSIHPGNHFYNLFDWAFLEVLRDVFDNSLGHGKLIVPNASLIIGGFFSPGITEICAHMVASLVSMISTA